MEDLNLDPLAAEKDRIRAAARARRAAAAQQQGGLGKELAQRFYVSTDLPNHERISGFWPIGDEIDTRPLLMRLAQDGHEVCLPVVVGRARPLVFRCWSPQDRLVPASFGTQVPEESKAEVVPAVMLIPLLAFDRRGYRLGYGGGFYDRTLHLLREAERCLAIGVAYAAQEIAAVPHGRHDQPLDRIVTESETITIRQA